jgi:hypothetical protein
MDVILERIDTGRAREPGEDEQHGSLKIMSTIVGQVAADIATLVLIVVAAVPVSGFVAFFVARRRGGR